VQLLLDIVGVVLGLAVGAVAGYAIGRRFERRRTTLWWVVAPALATVWIVDFAGYLSGHPEISLGSIGLMAGLLTGVKYGAWPQIRVWETPPVGGAQPPEHGDAPASEDTGAPRGI
jgi:hypothetical protein